MQITFLIGNGFDIGIGLNTRYEDFYKLYCDFSENDNENIVSFKKTLQNREKDKENRIVDWADFETAFGRHSEDFVIEEKDLYIERFEDFVSGFNAYLETEEKNIDYSDETLIANTIKTAVTTYFHIRNGDKEEIQQTYNANSNNDRVYNFISFNYTKALDKCLNIFSESLKSDKTRRIGKVCHIHGYIESNMIMGVNDASQITNEEFANDLDVISEIVKPQQNKEARTRYENDAISIIKSSNIICIYGMSIGATDKKWWDIISEWLTISETRRLIIMKYDKEYNPRFTYSQRRSTNKTVDNFLSYSSLPKEKKNNIKNRIYVGANHNVFAMDLRKKLISSNSEDSIAERVNQMEKEIDGKVSYDDLLVLNCGTSHE